MDASDLALVQSSLASVRPIAAVAADLFYGRLFEIAPETRPLFKDDIAEQGRKLMATLSVVVTGLDRLDTILPAASALAKRHVAYGVVPEHYGKVGEALLWTLARGLGSDWTVELESAWTRAFAKLSEFMIAEGYGRSAAPEGASA